MWRFSRGAGASAGDCAGAEVPQLQRFSRGNTEEVQRWYTAGAEVLQRFSRGGAEVQVQRFHRGSAVGWGAAEQVQQCRYRYRCRGSGACRAGAEVQVQRCSVGAEVLSWGRGGYSAEGRGQR